MAKLLKLRRGTTSQHSSFTGAEGEITVDTTKDTVVVHDGSTAGGHALAKEGVVPTTITVADESSDTTCFPLFVTAATGNLAPKSGSNITFNSSSGLLETTALTTTGNVIVGGDLWVSGTTTTINSTTLTVDDKNIELGSVSTPSDTTADGGGITLKGATDKTFNWVDTTDAWTSSEHIHLGDDKKLLVGTGSDLQVYHDQTNSRIHNTTGNLIFRTAGNFGYYNAAGSETLAQFTVDGSCELYHDNSKKIETTAAGVTVTGTVTDSKGDLRSVPKSDKSSAYTIVSADSGTVLYTQAGITVPYNTVAAGTIVTIINTTGSDITITQASNMVLNNSADATTGNRTLAGKGMATIYFPNTQNAYISGAGLS